MTIPIFVGSDSRMGKAEAVLEYTLRKHASRPVDITWMRAGDPGWTVGPGAEWNIGREPGKPYTAQGWATDFSCFRWAVPHLAQGKAIYLDVDMALFADIAELFDIDLGGRPLGWAGNRPDVILFDSTHKFWRDWPQLPLLKSCGERPHYYVDRVRGHAVALPSEWDETQAVKPETKLFHWTNMRTQPWRPWPEAFDYDAHGVAPERDRWFALYDQTPSAVADDYVKAMADAYRAEAGGPRDQLLIQRLRMDPVIQEAMMRRKEALRDLEWHKDEREEPL